MSERRDSEPAPGASAKEIFQAALERPATSRDDFVDDACAGDPALRADVRALLRHVEDSESSLFVTPPPATGAADELRTALRRTVEPSVREGDRIGPFLVHERLGIGGTSLVHRATQEQPVRREVAIKVLKPGMDSAAILDRFDRERDVLASVEHPQIARFIDAGLADDGRSYFAMELVRGDTLLAWCDARQLGITERVDLFVDVCRGVHHAHMRGVLHRDLKPSNIMVTDDAGTPVPKIIDFGIAKATYARSAIATAAGSAVGTPAYMSPEQWRGEADVDVRADVYALGVVLYELLTGHHPHPIEGLDDVSPSAVRDAIERSDPIPISTRVVRSVGPEPSAVGGLPRAELARALRGDIEWILLRALARRREDRYASVAELMDDLSRFRRHEPIRARPPGLVYRARKLAHRRPALAAAATMASLGVVVGIAAVIYHSQRVGRELDLRTAALERAETAERSALNRAEELEAVIDFRTDRLGAIVPQLMGDRIRSSIIAAAPADTRADLAAQLDAINFTDIGLGSMQRNLFDPTRAAIDEHFGNEPLIAARLLEAMSESQRDLGLLTEAFDAQAAALDRLQAELGDDDPRTLQALHLLGSLDSKLGRATDANRRLRAAFEGRRRVLGPDHRDTLASANNLGLLLLRLDRVDEAEPLLVSAMEGTRRAVGQDHPDALMTMNNVGLVRQHQGRLREAEAIHREVLAGRRRALGDDHPATLMSIANVGTVLDADGRSADAEPWYREAERERRRVLGARHPATLQSLNNLGYLVARLGDRHEAIELLRQCRTDATEALGPDHRTTLSAMHNLAYQLRAVGELEAALAVGEETLRRRERSAGHAHSATLSTLHNLGFLHEERGDLPAAESAFREVLTRARDAHGDATSETLLAGATLAEFLVRHAGFEEGETIARQILSSEANEDPAGRLARDQATRALARALAGQGRAGEAMAVLDAALERLAGESGALADQARAQFEQVRDELQASAETTRSDADPTSSRSAPTDR